MRQHQGRRPVIDAAGIACRDTSVLLEHRAQPCQRLCGSGLGVLVDIEVHRRAFHHYLDGYDLLCEMTRLDCRNGAALAFEDAQPGLRVSVQFTPQP